MIFPPLPASTLGPDHGARVYEYINTSTPTSTPTARIFKSFEVKDYSAPLVLSFSSRGPNAITREILKPDLTAPGVSILVAWFMAATVTDLLKTKDNSIQYHIRDIDVLFPCFRHSGVH
ncbi:PREDICTED: cucumisin-like [Erythranthe guttata]|uniref:cucumisin-like n=1 Tax=Erythranthe guttata TaxID=4155 RepID=UPI00064DD771|nr:PREDICTED: cucumisin-like [Erythranthe guttata]|eukprot:XP_012858116.1 PREDICTED: cucumisin-like [Erythranthe guttata]